MKSKKATRVREIQAEMGAMAAQLRDMLKCGRAHLAELERMPEYKAASEAGDLPFDPAIVRQTNSVPYDIAGDLCELIDKAPDIVERLAAGSRVTEAQMRRQDQKDHALEIERRQRDGEDELVTISRASLERLKWHVVNASTGLEWATTEIERAQPKPAKGGKAIAA